MVRSVSCLVLGLVLAVAGSWRPSRAVLLDGDLGLIRGSDNHNPRTSLACEYATIVAPQVVSCVNQPNNTPCIQCKDANGMGLDGYVPGGGFDPTGTMTPGAQANCNTYTKKVGTCFNGGCANPQPDGFCAAAVSQVIASQPINP